MGRKLTAKGLNKKLPTLAKLKKDLQPIFNKFIRLRDSDGGYFKCISCGVVKDITSMNAGHFYNVKQFDGLRFDENNVHGECQGCNGFNEAHLIDYTENLKEKIGDEKFKALKQKAKDYKANKGNWGFTRMELQAKKAYYSDKIRNGNFN